MKYEKQPMCWILQFHHPNLSGSPPSVKLQLPSAEEIKKPLQKKNRHRYSDEQRTKNSSFDHPADRASSQRAKPS